jgi:hypothetical protein
MGEVVHTSRIRIVREKGPTRRAVIEGFAEPVYYGVHGGIKKFYKIEPEEEHAARPLPGGRGRRHRGRERRSQDHAHPGDVSPEGIA